MRTGTPAGRRGASFGVVEEEQVLALDVEDERLRVGRLGAQHARVEQAVEQEGGVAGLGGDAGDAGDVDVGALGAVEEVEVEVDRLAVAGQAAREAAAPSCRRRAPLARSTPVARRTSLPGQRRHEHLGLEPGGLHHAPPRPSRPAGRRRRRGTRRSRSGRPRGGPAPGRRCRRSARRARRAGPRSTRDHVVELEVLSLARRRPRTRAAWRPRCRGRARPHHVRRTRQVRRGDRSRPPAELTNAL